MSDKITETKKFYDTHATSWVERHTNSFHHEVAFSKLAAKLPKGAQVLDIGCANGIHVPLFVGIGRHLKYTGVDISASFLKIAKKRYPQYTFLKANIADKKTLPKKKFDAFIAAAVLMHVPLEKWDTMLGNIKSISTPGALGYIVLPTAHPSGTPSESDVRHFTLFTPEEQETQLVKAGFKILKKGISDGTKIAGIWRWYIVKLPS